MCSVVFRRTTRSNKDLPDSILLGDDPQAVLPDEADLSFRIKLDLETRPIKAMTH